MSLNCYLVFIALVVVIGSLLLSALQKIMKAVINSRYIPPSYATIDQAMPEEILEQIFSFMDPLTLQQAHNVSRYWRSHASKNRVKASVIQHYTNSVRASDYVQGLVTQFGENILYRYPASYSIDLRLNDMALAEKKGKKLLELQLTAEMSDFILALNGVGHEMYAIKSSATLFTTLPTFRVGPKTVKPFDGKPMLHMLSSNEYGRPDNSVIYEVMLDLEYYCKVATSPEPGDIFMVRNLTEKKGRFGIIPFDGSFVQVLAYLLIPLIVHDVLYSESFMKMIKPWFGSIAFLILNGVLTQETWSTLKYTNTFPHAGLFKKMVISTSTGSIIVFILLYPLSSTHFAFLGLVIGTAAYFWTLTEYVFGQNFIVGDKNSYVHSLHAEKTKQRIQIFFVCVGLIVLMNDWSMTIRSIIDGTLWYRLFWNTIHYAFFLLYAEWISVMSAILYDHHQIFGWKMLMNWDKEMIKQFVYFYVDIYSCIYNIVCAVLARKSLK